MRVLIVHITTRSAWEAARSSGSYQPPSVAAEGFIHFSDVDQVVAVANTAFSGKRDLVLLRVAADRLEAPLRYESSDAAYVRSRSRRTRGPLRHSDGQRLGEHPPPLEVHRGVRAANPEEMKPAARGRSR